MTSSDQPLPLDPGAVPASLRDAYVLAEASRRAGASGMPPVDADAELLLDDSADDLDRLSVVDQLLGSRQGVEALAHLVAARVSTATPAVDLPASGTPTSTVPLAFVASPAEARRRRVGLMLKPVLLAATLMMVAGTSWYVFTLPPAADQLRTLGSTVELTPVEPAAQSAPVTLAWKTLPTVSRYRVEILDANDDPVFSTETSDTTATVPAGSLKSGTYRWWVRSRSTDGSEIRSRVEKLVIR